MNHYVYAVTYEGKERLFPFNNQELTDYLQEIMLELEGSQKITIASKAIPYNQYMEMIDPKSDYGEIINILEKFNESE